MIKDYLNKIGKELKGKNEDSIEYKIYKTELTKRLEKDLKNNNPDKILNDYVEYFSQKELKTIRIKKGAEFYRGRIGSKVVQGAIDDFNTQFIMPYYGGMIEAAPPLYTSGGRFNRAGISYLYLSTDIETCFAEVHLQVGQECSIAKFKCINDIELINLSDFGNDLELKAWYEILTQPVHDEIKYKYFITQFIAEVLMKLNSNGLYFKSVQSTGNNIVCFKPHNFELITYSEKLFMAQKLRYEYIQVEDAIRKFAKRDDTHLINDLNTDLVEENEKQIEFLNEWIEKEKSFQDKN
ncbi:TPA: RES family NAD+ phosphorylase [Clostridioides difficile]|uniref:RES family NAD+ phosphorylase n=1 Tax=Clostridioides difficile TaxID=1496 RepID=UPI0003B2A8C0|nr:RES family NAD+ phosphorylase [Clostridioides difficile]MCI4242041.1 RES family NAD+ phosphorylase [Clostridioides difficile]MDB9599650.1 RES family NAD+ phosphorylase [Clostridioides difficile]MDN9363204.1 RES family NAD+ phosphorylase [Clostridioides difficile]MDN9409050.1 RES family NAD+ phosphorylase [Clostridioides difficile]MDN9511345.1 RES family NAD+ phosphorylase [Clostridioides difficile]